MKSTLILILFSTILLLLFFIEKKRTTVIAFIIILPSIFLSIWQGDKFYYISNIDNTIKNYNVLTFDYGTNTNYKTYSVNTSKYYRGNTGLANWYDKQYWGFTYNLPLNGHVYYPKEKGNYPLIFILHGNALSEKKSHLGYDYLLKELANNGYIAVSIDQNFLNGNWTTLGLGQPRENDVRGLLAIEHIKLFNKLNNDKNSVLFDQIDIDNIGLIGHSRGGEAVAIAAKYSTEFPIKAVMSISGTDRQFRETINLKDISYIALHGANDGDLKKFKARSQFNRVNFTTTDFNIKSTYYIEGLNHAQFNTQWGKTDSSNIGKIFYGNNNNIKSVDQKEIAIQLSLNLFNTIIKKDYSKLDYLKNPNLIKSIPKISFITDYYDSNMQSFTNLLEEKNMIKKKVYRNNDSFYEIKYFPDNSIKLKNNTGIMNIKSLNISLANTSYKDLNISIEIFNSGKIVNNDMLLLKSAIKKRVFKTDLFFKGLKIEPNFQLFEIDFDEVDNWDYIELSFLDDNKEGVVLLNDFSYTILNLKKE